MAQSKEERKTVVDAEIYIRSMRQKVMNNYRDHGQMPRFINYRGKVKLEHEALIKPINPTTFTRAKGILKSSYGCISAAIGSLLNPENLHLFVREIKDEEIGFLKALVNFLRRCGLGFLITGTFSVISTLITECFEEVWKQCSTFVTSTIINIANAAVGCVMSAVFTVVIQACFYLYHHWKECRLKKKLNTNPEFEVQINEKIRQHRISKKYITSWRNIIKNLFIIVLGGIATVFTGGIGLLITAILIPWIIWAVEKLYDHFTGQHEIGVLTKITDFIFGIERHVNILEYWNVHSEQEEQIPDIFLCPITLEMMVHPVINNCGQIYDRDALHQWLSTKGNDPRDPKTNGVIALDSIKPLPELELYIKEYAKQNGISLEKEVRNVGL